MTDRDEQLSPDASAILGAIEAPTDEAFEAAVARLDDAGAARARAMRADRMAVVAATVGATPPMLFSQASAVAFGEIDPEVLARLGEGNPAIEGLPVSRVRVYDEPWAARLWRHRRAIGLAAAAGLAVAAVIGVQAGVRAVLDGRGDGRRIAAIEATEPASGGSSGVTETGSADPEPIVRTVEAAPMDAPVEAWAAWAARPLTDVFEAAPMLGSGRVVVHVRSGSAALTASALESVAAQRIGPDHSFEVREGLPEAVVASIGMPAMEPPVVASEDGGGPVVEPRRTAWTARVRNGPAALAALRKRLEDAGLSVSFYLLDEAVAVPSVGANAGDAGAGESGPPAFWHRSAVLPVVVDSLVD